MGYTDADLVEALCRFANNHGRPPTAPEANEREDLPSVTAFIHHFGTWNAAIAKAGLEPRDRRRSDDELLAELRVFAADRGEYPTYTAVADADGMASPSTYQQRFGSWNDALAAAGLPTFNVSTIREESE